MPGRGATGTIITEMGKSQNMPFHLFEAYFDTETIYMTDCPRDVLWNGNTYLGSGSFISFDQIEEGVELIINKITVVLSGADPSIIALAMSEQFIDRALNIYKGFFDSNGTVIVNPILIFGGKMDGCSLNEDVANGTATVSVPASSDFVEFDKSNGRQTNLTSQQFYYPNDTAFKFMSDLANKVIKWH